MRSSSSPARACGRRLRSKGAAAEPHRKAGSFRFQNALRLIEISNNHGDGKSLIPHPATTTRHRFKPEERAALGIDDGLAPPSVGLEDPADLIADLDQALEVA
jgi:O-succinylhomoserine sulfhydrylase